MQEAATQVEFAETVVIRVRGITRLAVATGAVLLGGCANIPHVTQTRALRTDEITDLCDRLQEATKTEIEQASADRGGIELRRTPANRYVVWLSSPSRAGGAVVGVFDDTKHLVAFRQTAPITSVSSVTVKGLGTAVCLQEQAGAGTGFDALAVRLIDPYHPHDDLWYAEVGTYEQGVPGRNEGRTFVGTACLFDADHDGLDEILLFEVDGEDPLLNSNARRALRGFHYSRRTRVYEPWAPRMTVLPAAAKPR